MNVLLVSATHLEIMPLLQRCDWPSGWGPVYSTMIGKHTVDVLLSGPGVVAASYQLGTLLGMRRYDLAVQAGIAGSFRQNLHPERWYILSRIYLQTLAVHLLMVFYLQHL